MLRAQIVTPKKDLVISEVPIPSPPPESAVVKIIYAGICHSDLIQWNNQIDEGDKINTLTDHPMYNLPVTPGHEIAGIIHSMNTEKTNFSVGDRVLVYPWIGCMNCVYCNKERYSLCQDMTKHKYITYVGFGCMRPGGYSTHCVSELKFLLAVPTSIPLNIACMLPCSGLTTYSAVQKIKPSIAEAVFITGKASVLIIGAGGLGLWAIQLAKKLLPPGTEVIIADIAEDKLAIARQHGCDGTVLWDTAVDNNIILENTNKMGNRGGFDAVIDLVGRPITSERGFSCLNQEGILVVVGLYGGAAKISLPQLALQARKIQGSFVGSLSSLRELVQLVASEKVLPPPTTYVQLKDVTNVLEQLDKGKFQGRGIISFEQNKA